jgi:hypothetical protein
MAERAEEPVAGTVEHAPQVRGRVLAIEIRSTRMGFAVLEEMELVDWGTRYLLRKTRSLKPYASVRTRDLLTTYRPAVVVARERKHFSASANKRFATILEAVREEVRYESAKFKMFSVYSVERHFAGRGCSTKHEIATNLVRRFEYLSWKLPKPRKSYESEVPIMTVFDAVATGLAFLETNADHPSLPDGPLRWPLTDV